MIDKVSGVQRNLKNIDRSALISRELVNESKPFRNCIHCKKNGHTINFYQDLYLGRRNSKNREEPKNLGRSNEKKKVTKDVDNSTHEGTTTEEKKKKVADWIQHLQTYIGHFQQEEDNDTLNLKKAFAAKVIEVILVNVIGSLTVGLLII